MMLRAALFAALALLAALPLAAVEDSQKALLREVEELRALETAGSAGPVLLDQIVRSVPELLWLEEMTLRAGKVHVSGQAFNTNAIARFIETLDAVPAFDEPALIDTTENPDGTSYSFKLAFRFSPVPPEEEDRPGPRAGIEALERERDELSRRLARREDVRRILDELRTLAKDLDLGGSSFVEARSRDPREARVDVDVAATFHGLTMLFDRLRRLSALTLLDELTVRQELTERGTIAASFRLRIPLRRPE